MSENITTLILGYKLLFVVENKLQLPSVWYDYIYYTYRLFSIFIEHPA